MQWQQAQSDSHKRSHIPSCCADNNQVIHCFARQVAEEVLMQYYFMF